MRFLKGKRYQAEVDIAAQAKAIELTQQSDAEIKAKAERSFKELLTKHEFEILESQKKVKHRIVPAFVFEGVQYMKFDDVNTMPFMRSFAAMDAYAEVESRCTREYLEATCKSLNDQADMLANSFMAENGVLDLNKSNKHATNIKQISKQIAERNDMLFAVDTVLKLAAVMYFDSTENPEDFDSSYSRKKIQKWKDGGLDSFFLTMPLNELMPYLELSEEDLSNYIQVESKISSQQMKVLTGMQLQDRVRTVIK